MVKTLRHKTILRGLAAGLVVVTLLGLSVLADAQRDGSSAEPVGRGTAAATLDNPGFDNHVWYYDNYVPGSDASFVPSYWTIWYKDGTVPYYTRQTTVHVDGGEAVRGHVYWAGTQEAGVYQVVDGATPCLTYQFQMYGMSLPGEGDDILTGMKVGIHPTGYYPPDRAAKDGEGFSDTVWGTSQSACNRTWCHLSVSAEAESTNVTVYVNGQGTGGTSHDMAWDGGSFADVTPAEIVDDPEAVADKSLNPSADNITSSGARISWTTGTAALGQVYYRQAPVTTTITGLTYTVYLPLIMNSGSNWQTTALNKTSTTSHEADLSGLEADTEYEYIVVSRGLSGGQCTTWASTKRTFSTAP